MLLRSNPETLAKQLLSLCAFPNPRLTGNKAARARLHAPARPCHLYLLEMHLLNPATRALLDCSSVCRPAAWTPHCCSVCTGSFLLPFWVQGAILHAPACDAERGPVLHIMAAVQSVLVPVIPYWRLVPVPPLKNVSWDAQVRWGATGCGHPAAGAIHAWWSRVSGKGDSRSQGQGVVLQQP